MNTRPGYYTCATQQAGYVLTDISNWVTWSFPEFIPFCAELYYFSSFKKFACPGQVG